MFVTAALMTLWSLIIESVFKMKEAQSLKGVTIHAQHQLMDALIGYPGEWSALIITIQSN